MHRILHRLDRNRIYFREDLEVVRTPPGYCQPNLIRLHFTAVW